MRRPWLTAVIGILCTLVWAGTSLADQVIDVHLSDKVTKGQKPSLTVSVHKDLSELSLDLKRDDGKRIQLTKTNVPRSSERTFELPQTSGKHRYRGTLKVTFQSGEGAAMNLDFTAMIMPSMGLNVRSGELDLEAHELKLRSKRGLARVDYRITAENGALIGDGTFEPPQAGTPLTVVWEQNPGKVLKIHLNAHDTEGFTEELDLFPWRWSVPHEEVIFETGEWDILDSEAPKLDKSYLLIQEGLDKYGKLLPIKLYIGGHTDTVAAADTNLVLSQKRALSIARYFRSKGFRHPIYYQGFGEGSLKVPTPDETDEQRNRRAEYDLAAQPPPVNVAGAAARWKRL